MVGVITHQVLVMVEVITHHQDVTHQYQVHDAHPASHNRFYDIYALIIDYTGTDHGLAPAIWSQKLNDKAVNPATYPPIT